MIGPDPQTYVLIDPRDARIRYVGCTGVGLEKALVRHWSDRRNCHRLGRWMQELERARRRPIGVIVATFNCEYETVRALVAAGADLVNEKLVGRARREVYSRTSGESPASSAVPA